MEKIVPSILIVLLIGYVFYLKDVISKQSSELQKIGCPMIQIRTV